MKKAISIFGVLVLTLVITSCGGSAPPVEEPSAEEHAEHPTGDVEHPTADAAPPAEDAEHPADGAEHPDDGAEHPADHPAEETN